MILPLLALQAATATAAPTYDPVAACRAAVRRDPAAAERSARGALGTGAAGKACLGLALAAQAKWAEAAPAFADAARTAELSQDQRAADYWAQSGNAWLAAGDATKARGALDAALAAGTLTGPDRGEAFLDRARALVAAGDPAAARTDMDEALKTAAEDPLAWLLSATLARRTGDLPRASADITRALALAGDDAQVQLEAGNIAAAGGDAAKAQAAWREAARLAPTAPAGRSAAQALSQFTTTEAK